MGGLVLENPPPAPPADVEADFVQQTPHPGEMPGVEQRGPLSGSLQCGGKTIVPVNCVRTQGTCPQGQEGLTQTGFLRRMEPDPEDQNQEARLRGMGRPMWNAPRERMSLQESGMP